MPAVSEAPARPGRLAAQGPAGRVCASGRRYRGPCMGSTPRAPRGKRLAVGARSLWVAMSVARGEAPRSSGGWRLAALGGAGLAALRPPEAAAGRGRRQRPLLACCCPDLPPMLWRAHAACKGRASRAPRRAAAKLLRCSPMQSPQAALFFARRPPPPAASGQRRL